jgi:hypothetical protein
VGIFSQVCDKMFSLISVGRYAKVVADIIVNKRKKNSMCQTADADDADVDSDADAVLG